MPRVNAPQPPVVAAESVTTLAKPLLSERLRTLLRQQKALLAKIKQEQKQRERLAGSVRDTMDAVMSRVQPLFVERDQLSDAIHGLFGELLAQGRLPKRSRYQVADLYATLREVLGPNPHAHGHVEHEPDDADEAPRHEPSRHSAAHVGGDVGKESVREVFRRLALALHPDRAKNELDRQQRTEAMKQLTRAYESGDLAALLEAERLWLAGKASPVADFDAQCAALMRAVTELKAQLRLLRAEVKELKRSPAIAMAQQLKRGAREASTDVLGEAVSVVADDVQRLRELHDFVCAFRDRKLPLAEFLQGPPSLRADAADLEEQLFDFLEREIESTGRRAARGR